MMAAADYIAVTASWNGDSIAARNIPRKDPSLGGDPVRRTGSLIPENGHLRSPAHPGNL
jgi:hypothetical protein